MEAEVWRACFLACAQVLHLAEGTGHSQLPLSVMPRSEGGRSLCFCGPTAVAEGCLQAVSLDLTQEARSWSPPP